jgi:hypothetical protein
MNSLAPHYSSIFRQENVAKKFSPFLIIFVSSWRERVLLSIFFFVTHFLPATTLFVGGQDPGK